MTDRWFRYPEDRWPVACFALCFVVDLVVFALCPWWGAAAWLILGIFPKACISAWGHHHQHLYMFRPAWLNRCLEFILGFQTGATSHAWFLHHVIGHHPNYKDQSRDESAWQTPDGRQMGTVEYSTIVTATSYWRLNRNGPRYPRQWRIFWAMLILHVLAVAAFLYLNWVNAILVFILPTIISLYITAWHTYYHHAGLLSENDYESSWNITHRWYNRLTGNLGYHTAHHLKGGLHWSRLPELHASIAPQIPARLYRRPCWPFYWLPAGEAPHARAQPPPASASVTPPAPSSALAKSP